MVGMFAGVILDTLTTWAFVSQHRGFEQNPILAPLTRHSLIWIPIYLLCRPLLVPLLPDLCRFGFGVYFGLAGLLFGANNLAGSFFGRYFLVEMFGFQALQGACILFAIVVFIWAVCRHASTTQERKRHIMVGLCWIGVFVLIELGFLAAGRLAFS
jgi:hypothetical protein